LEAPQVGTIFVVPCPIPAPSRRTTYEWSDLGHGFLVPTTSLPGRPSSGYLVRISPPAVPHDFLVSASLHVFGSGLRVLRFGEIRTTDRRLFLGIAWRIIEALGCPLIHAPFLVDAMDLRLSEQMGLDSPPPPSFFLDFGAFHDLLPTGKVALRATAFQEISCWHPQMTEIRGYANAVPLLDVEPEWFAPLGTFDHTIFSLFRLSWITSNLPICPGTLEPAIFGTMFEQSGHVRFFVAEDEVLDYLYEVSRATEAYLQIAFIKLGAHGRAGDRIISRFPAVARAILRGERKRVSEESAGPF